MDATRIQKIERQIQKDLGEIFLLETKSMSGVLVSVTKVRISPDMGLARTYLSIFPAAKGKEILEAINLNKKALRFELGQRVKNQFRKVPELAFFIDDSLDYLENIDNLLNKTKGS